MTAGVNNDGLSVPVPNVASGVPPTSALASSHTLQGYMENVFMNIANNLLYNKMLPLQSALTLTQDALNLLATIQNIHNDVAAPAIPGFLSSNTTFTKYSGATVANYTSPASAYFNSQVSIAPSFSTVALTSGAIASALAALLAVPTSTPSIPLSLSGLIEGLQDGAIDIAGTTLNTAGGSAPFTPASAGLLIAPITSPATPPAYPYIGETTTGGSLNIPGAQISYQGLLQFFLSAKGISYASTYQIIASAQAYRMGEMMASTYSPAYMSALNQFIQVKNQLSGQVLPALLASNPSAAANPNSLYSNLKIVLSGMQKINVQSSLPIFHVTKRSAVGTGAASGVHYYIYSGYYSYPSASPDSFASWLIDGYNTTAGAGANSAGAINQDIVNAITSGESINTQQTSSVSNYLLMYQQYYQTAAAILQQMTQVIEQVAQGIKSS